jgi:glycosyltransferase involved in cell wall biosynthesis
MAHWAGISCHGCAKKQNALHKTLGWEDEMTHQRSALIVVENSWLPFDPRLWQMAESLRDAGWRVTVICPAASGEAASSAGHVALDSPDEVDGIRVYRFPVVAATSGVKGYLQEFVSAFVSITRLSWRVWRQDRFDLMHLCNPPDIFFPLAAFYRLLGVRVLLDYRDLFPEQIDWRYRGLTRRLLIATARIMEYLTFRSVHAVLATNHSYRQIAIQRGRMAPDRVVVVRYGPESATFVPAEPDPQIKGEYPYLACYAGVMGPEDGLLDMVKAIRYVIQDLERRDIKFLLMGDGVTRQAALDRIKAWRLGDQVQMPGMILDKQQLRRNLSTADVCLSPEPLTPLNARSTFIKIGDYMALGKPVVATDLTETRYTAQDAARYVPPGDTAAFGRAIVELIDDPAQRQQMGDYARQRTLNELSWEHQQAHLFRLYEITLSAPRVVSTPRRKVT